MRCTNCDYPLWNLKTRACPECGETFRPSEAEFTPNSVQFCCPHCEQAYYGTTNKGHLHPPEFNCVSCGRHIHMDECILRPADGVRDEETTPVRLPWLNRKRDGWTKSWFRTIGWALVRPGQAMRGLPLESSQIEAWWFMVLTHLVIAVVAIVPLLLLMGFAAFVPAGGGPGGGPGPWAAMATAMGVSFGFFFLGLLIYAAIWGAVAHVILRIGGRPHSGIGRTYQAICYSSGANVCTAVPCFGQYFGWIWWIVSAILMIKDAQKVSGWRATAAGLTLPMITLVSVIGLYAWFIYMAISSAGGFPGVAAAATAAATPEVQAMETAVRGWKQANDEPWPAHAVELLADGHLTDEWEFVAAATMTTPSDAPIGDGSLDEFAYAGNARKDALVRMALDNQPEDVIAHRLGDYVFTYHGMPDPPPDPGLWILAQVPDPATNPSVRSAWGTEMIHILEQDGTITSTRAPQLAPLLQQQNQLRRQHGLPPLPDLVGIRHGMPARASDAGPDPLPDDLETTEDEPVEAIPGGDEETEPDGG